MDTIRAGSAGVKDLPDPRSKESGTNYWMRDKAGRKQLWDAWNDERFDWSAPAHTIVTTSKGMGRRSVIDVHTRRGWVLRNVVKVEKGESRDDVRPRRRCDDGSSPVFLLRDERAPAAGTPR